MLLTTNKVVVRNRQLIMECCYIQGGVYLFRKFNLNILFIGLTKVNKHNQQAAEMNHCVDWLRRSRGDAHLCACVIGAMRNHLWLQRSRAKDYNAVSAAPVPPPRARTIRCVQASGAQMKR